MARQLLVLLMLLVATVGAWAEPIPVHVVTPAGDFLLVLQPELDPAGVRLVADRVRQSFYRGGCVKRVSEGEFQILPAGQPRPALKLAPPPRQRMGLCTLLLVDDRLVILVTPQPRWMKNPRARVVGTVEGPHVLDALRAGQSAPVQRLEFLSI